MVDTKKSREATGRTGKRKLLYAPLICGVLAFLAFVIYLWSGNGLGINLSFVIYFIPLFCLAGTVMAIINRRDINTHPALWTIGFLISVVGLLCCLFMIMLVLMLF